MPLRYEEARAEVEARGGQVQVASGGFGIVLLAVPAARGEGADDLQGGGRRAGSDNRLGDDRPTRGGSPRSGGETASRASGRGCRRRAEKRSPRRSETCRPAAPTRNPPLPARPRPRRQGGSRGSRPRTRSPWPSATCRPARPCYASAAPALARSKPEMVDRRARAARSRQRRFADPGPQPPWRVKVDSGPLPPRDRPSTDLDTAAALAGARAAAGACPAELILRLEPRNEARGRWPPPSAEPGGCAAAGPGADPVHEALPKVIAVRSRCFADPARCQRLPKVQPSQGSTTARYWREHGRGCRAATADADPQRAERQLLPLGQRRRRRMKEAFSPELFDGAACRSGRSRPPRPPARAQSDLRGARWPFDPTEVAAISRGLRGGARCYNGIWSRNT